MSSLLLSLSPLCTHSHTHTNTNTHSHYVFNRFLSHTHSHAVASPSPTFLSTALPFFNQFSLDTLFPSTIFLLASLSLAKNFCLSFHLYSFRDPSQNSLSISLSFSFPCAHVFALEGQALVAMDRLVVHSVGGCCS